MKLHEEKGSDEVPCEQKADDLLRKERSKGIYFQKTDEDSPTKDK